MKVSEFSTDEMIRLKNGVERDVENARFNPIIPVDIYRRLKRASELLSCLVEKEVKNAKG